MCALEEKSKRQVREGGGEGRGGEKARGEREGGYAGRKGRRDTAREREAEEERGKE